MAQYDGSIRINTQIDTKNASSQMMGLANQIQKTADRVSSLRSKMDALRDAQIPTQKYKDIETDISRAEKELQKLIEKQAQMQAEGKDNGSSWERLNQRIQATKDYIAYAREEMQQLVDTGKAFTVGRDTQEYANLGQQLGYAESDLARLNRRYDELNAKQVRVPEQFEKMRKSAKKAFGAISQGTKKSSGLFSTFISRLKGIALSLLIFNWISKGFNAMISGMKKGFENFMGYSDSYAQSVQNMKNAMSTLGNQFAAAFAPIVQMVIPWLNSLINALTKAMAQVSQFFAILSGKSTFTRAVQIQDKYNKSLGGTAKAADKARGALAKFDDLDVLEKKDNTSGGGAGAENAGADMFEEVPVDTEVLSFWQRVQEAMKPVIEYARRLKDIFSQGFFDGLGDWEYRWESIKNSIDNIKNSILGIITDTEVLNAVGESIESTIRMIGTVIGSIASIILSVIAGITGGVAKFLEDNEERIKEFIISVSNIVTEINNMISKVAVAIAYVFEAFSSEEAQELIANILGIINATTGVIEIVLKVFRDLLNIVILPFIENADKLKITLEGLLGFLSSVLGTIEKGLDDTFAKLNEVYDEHFKPFFDSVAQGLSDIVGKLLEFFNVSVLPVIKGWADGFDQLWNNHIQPFIDSFIELLGQAADFLNAVWENILIPLINWIIDTILPQILPVIDGVVKAIGWAAGIIADIASAIIKTIGKIIEFLTNIFKGDWEGVWHGIAEFLSGSIVPSFSKSSDGVVSIFDNMWDKVKKVINSMLGGVESMANGIVRAINKMIEALNRISFSIPDWVPGSLGGKSFSLNLSTIPEVSIPRLATGAVIRGGNPFMAILGDQPAGKTNVEAPLATIEQAVENVMSRQGYGRENIPVNINLNYDGQTFARLSISDILSELGRQGFNVDVLGVN